MIVRHLGIATLACLLCAFDRPIQPEFGLDGHGPPPLAESSHSFDCGGIRASVRFRQEVARLLPDLSNLDRSSQVTLLDLTVGGRRVTSSDFARARSLLRTFAWIDNVRGICFGNEMEIWLKSMPLVEWVAYLREQRPDRPPLRLWTIRLSRAGVARIS